MMNPLSDNVFLFIQGQRLWIKDIRGFMEDEFNRECVMFRNGDNMVITAKERQAIEAAFDMVQKTSFEKLIES